MQASPPGLELMRRSRRFVVHVFYSCLLKFFMNAASCRSPFLRSHAHVKQVHLLIELGGLFQQTVISRFNTGKSKWSAEDSDVGELVEVCLGDLICLSTTKG